MDSVATREHPTLLDKYIWIIDDDIPVQLLDYERDDMLSGNRPIDRGSLLALLQKDGWDDEAVKSLVSQLIEEAKDVTAFTQPVTALDLLRKGAHFPDSIVYDLQYRTIPAERSREYLEQILNTCISVIQVYTKGSAEEACRELEELTNTSSRLEPPLNKADTNATELGSIIAERLNLSISARLAGDIRRLSSVAIENMLVKIDDLPIDIAVRLLVGDPAEPNELEFIEFVSIKVSETLSQEKALKDALSEYATIKGVNEENIGNFIGELVDFLTSYIQEKIQQDNQFQTTLRSIWEGMGEKNKSGENEKIIRDFLAFRFYTKPTDDFVRTGDVMKVNETSEDFPDLYLVLTPICDLDKFLYKTRGVLTVAKMHPIVDEKGKARVFSYGNKGFGMGHSITAKNPIFLPSIPVSDEITVDYGLFIHEVESLQFDILELIDAGKNNKKVRNPLTYSDLKRVTQICKVSEPFISGILAKLKDSLFRIGVPDLPQEEKDRLNNVLTNKEQS